MLSGPIASGTVVPSGATPNYPVNFTEAGLPAGTTWSVTLDNVTKSARLPWIEFYVPNGTHSYTVPNAAGELPTPGTGSVGVGGGNDTVVATVALSGTQPWGSVVDPATGNLYVAQWQRGNLSYLRHGSLQVSGNIPTGNHPEVPLLDPANLELYVPNFGSNNLTVVDPSTNHSVKNIAVRNQPVQAAYDGARQLVYVTDFGSASVSVINGSTNTVVATIGVGRQPSGLAYDSWNRELFVANTQDDNVSVISTDSLSVVATVTLPVGTAPKGVAFDSRTGSLFVTGCANCAGTILNGSTHAVAGGFSEGSSAAYPVFDPQNGYVYVPDSTGSGVLTVVNGADASAVATISVGASPQSAAFDPLDGRLYVPSSPGNSLTIIDGRTYTRAIAFASPPPQLYPLDFAESGLPAKTRWSVTLGVTTVASGATTIAFSLANGSYNYSIDPVPGYSSAPTLAAATVQGAAVDVPVQFSALPPPRYTLAFTQSGLATNTNWTVTVAGTSYSSALAAILVSLPNGSYPFAVASVAGYSVAAHASHVDVRGAGFPVPIDFTPLPPPRFAILFQEQGLPIRTPWSLTVAGSALTSHGSSAEVWCSNGTYTYYVSPPAGYSAAPSGGSVAVNGSNTSVALDFRTNTTTTGGSDGTRAGPISLSSYLYAMFAVLGALIVIAGVLVGRRYRGRPEPVDEKAGPEGGTLYPPATTIPEWRETLPVPRGGRPGANGSPGPASPRKADP